MGLTHTCSLNFCFLCLYQVICDGFRQQHIIKFFTDSMFKLEQYFSQKAVFKKYYFSFIFTLWISISSVRQNIIFNFAMQFFGVDFRKSAKCGLLVDFISLH